MTLPSPGFAITLHIDAPAGAGTTARLSAAVAAAGGAVTALGAAPHGHDRMAVEISCDATDAAQAHLIGAAVEALDDVTVSASADRTFQLHLGGKIEVTPRVALRHREDLARAYTPGVARVSMAIAADRSEARRLTIKKNTVAIVTDGSAVLGLGDIGPEAALPVMEGKAALFKRFAGVDAWPVCLDTRDTDRIVEVVRCLAPVYGGINLEDIAAPRCFEIERRLRGILDIPVFHDDQHGTAIVVLAALVNALTVVGKQAEEVRVVVSGVGAAGAAIIHLLLAHGVRHVIACNRHGALTPEDVDPDRRWIAEHTNPEGFRGPLCAALRGADVFVGVSGPNILSGADIATMAPGAIVFALANPVPEVDPVAASAHAAIVATGRSDHPNQINNVLAFPGVFRGLLDAGTHEITDAMLLAAAAAIARCVGPDRLGPGLVVPSVFDEAVAPAVAEAVRAVALAPGRHGGPPRR